MRLHNITSNLGHRSHLPKPIVPPKPQAPEGSYVGMSTQQEQVQDDELLASGSDQDEHPATEMSTLLDEMLENLTAKVDHVSEEINTKLDEMSRRLDNLETSILSQTQEEPRQSS
ncbi:hypothetical protein MMC26_000902 [Xylographa opegraphella]|nr:hypothetical protein [Xylographa opegraphella]